MVNGWILGFVSTRERDSHDASSFAADLPYVTLKTDREVQTSRDLFQLRNQNIEA